MKLYVCFSTKGDNHHACGRVFQALEKAGFTPEIEKVYGTRWLPKLLDTKGRRKIRKLTGNHQVPTLVLDNGTIVDHTDNIVEWAKTHK